MTTSPTTDIQPELLSESIALEDVTPTIAAAFADNPCLIYSGEHRLYWGANAHGYTPHRDLAGSYTIGDAYARTRHCDPEKLIRFVRLTLTTPTLGDMVMVPREPTEAMWAAGREAVNDQEPWSDLPEIWSAMLSAAPASPIPISANGEREPIIQWLNQVIERADKHGNTEGMWLFAKQWHVVLAALSPGLDNTAVEGLQAEITRLRGLLVDAGDPAWENARAILAAELMKAGHADEAVAIGQAQPANVPSWIALNLIALASRAALIAETEEAR